MGLPKGRGDDSELQTCAAWLRIVNGFVLEKAPSAELAQIAEECVVRSVASRNLKGLREAMRHSVEMASGMKSDDQEALDRMLVAQTGKGLYEAVRDTRRYVRRVLKRGSVRNAAEYRLLSSRADDIRDDASQQEEREAILRLVLTYQGSRGA